ncbi:MAG: hypothetical protein PHG73_04695 [Pygmaiobacter sp.]|nr:hypothetical protein [Pygmaiobacter sp.]
MNQKKSFCHRTVKSIIQSLVKAEYDGWPPFCVNGIYQPHRPEFKPAQRHDIVPEKESSYLLNEKDVFMEADPTF